MEAGTYDLKINQGKLFDQTFTWSIGGTPVDLTGYDAELVFYTASNPNVLTLTTTLDGSGNGLILGGPAGTVQLIMKTAKTKVLGFTRATYELQLTRPDAEDIPFLVGTATVRRENAGL